MKIEDVIEKLKGINCGNKGTSCPDQLSKALEKYIKAEAQFFTKKEDAYMNRVF